MIEILFRGLAEYSLTCSWYVPSASGCPIANRNKLRSLDGSSSGLGVGMVGVGVGVGGAAQSLLAASYGTAPLSTATPSHPSLLSRPLLHPLQPGPAKRIKLDDGTPYKTGKNLFISLFNFFSAKVL